MKERPTGWQLAAGASDHGEVMTFAATFERVILAEGKGVEFLWHQNSAEVRVSHEDDAEHIEDFAFHPVCATPEGADGGQGGGGQIDGGSNNQPFAGLHVEQEVDDAEAIGGAFVFEPVNGGEINEHLEAVFSFECSEDIEDDFGGNVDPAIISEGALRDFRGVL